MFQPTQRPSSGSTSNRSIPWNILVSYSKHLLNLMTASE